MNKKNTKRGPPWNPYHFILHETLKYEMIIPKLKNIYYVSPDSLMEIIDGNIFIQPPFSWDGMTYFYDGDPDPENPEYPITWKATAVHDAICKYWDIDDSNFPFNRLYGDIFLYDLLKQCKYKYSKLCFSFARTWSILRIIHKRIQI
jgi:hypothetical protein